MRNTLLIFVTLVTLTAIDVAEDLREGTTSNHVVVELAVVLFGLMGASYVAQKLLMARRRAMEATQALAILSQDVEVLTADAARWRDEAKELLAGLSAAIDVQFERWSLTETEKEVGLLLLKGLSHKEIAEIRQVTDTTVRQQARALYKKAHITGRNELSAFFLEDMLAPPTRQN